MTARMAVFAAADKGTPIALMKDIKLDFTFIAEADQWRTISERTA